MSLVRFRGHLLPDKPGRRIFGLRLDRCCSHHLPYGIYNRLRAVNLNVVAATVRDN